MSCKVRFVTLLFLASAGSSARVSAQVPSPEVGPTACSNGLDDDADGAFDCGDPDCTPSCGGVRAAPGQVQVQVQPGPPTGQAYGGSAYVAPGVATAPIGGRTLEGAPSGERTYPLRYALEPLTYAQGMLAPWLGTGWGQTCYSGSGFSGCGDAYVGLDVGVDYGILDWLNVGVTPVNTSLAPNAEYWNPSLGVRLRFIHSARFEMGVGSWLSLPFRSGSYAVLAVNVPMRVHGGDVFRLDITPNVGFYFDSDTSFGVGLPLSFGFSVWDYIYLGFHTGVSMGFDTTTRGEDLRPVIPFGVFVGGVVPVAQGPLVDLRLGFSFPYFLSPASGSGERDIVDVQSWSFGLDVAFRLYLL